jgi:predicted nuclease of predicted toxin-antitoxin system
LFDENLAASLAREFVGLYPGTAHVTPLGLGGGGDRAVWDRAAQDGYVLVTKDEDFHRLSLLLGPPPKVVWIRLGNCSTADVARLLRFRAAEIVEFTEQTEIAFLELG